MPGRKHEDRFSRVAAQIFQASSKHQWLCSQWLKVFLKIKSCSNLSNFLLKGYRKCSGPVVGHPFLVGLPILNREVLGSNPAGLPCCFLEQDTFTPHRL